jgi:hypothetical protein
MMISNEEEFHAEKARLQAETAAANKRFEDIQVQRQQFLLDSQLESAFSAAGGIGTDDAAFQAVKTILNCEIEGDRIIIRDRSGNIEKNADGTPKSIAEKMTELKQNPTCKSFFKADAAALKSPGNKPPLAAGQYYYTQEQAMAGKVKIEDINSGKAVAEPRKPNTPMEGFRQQTKVVNPEKILRGE